MKSKSPQRKVLVRMRQLALKVEVFSVLIRGVWDINPQFLSAQGSLAGLCFTSLPGLWLQQLQGDPGAGLEPLGGALGSPALPAPGGVCSQQLSLDLSPARGSGGRGTNSSVCSGLGDLCPRGAPGLPPAESWGGRVWGVLGCPGAVRAAEGAQELQGQARNGIVESGNLLSWSHRIIDPKSPNPHPVPGSGVQRLPGPFPGEFSAPAPPGEGSFP